MKTFIVQLYFRNSLHAGAANSIAGVDSVQDFIHSDTLWAALANNWALLGNVNGIDFEEFLESYRAGKPLFTLSSAFPLTDNGTCYWLPKPLSAPYGLSRNNPRRSDNMRSYGKDVKSILYMPLEVFREWSRFENFDLSLLLRDRINIAEHVRSQSMVDRVSMHSNLYNSELTYFDHRYSSCDRSGLYFLVRIDDNDAVSKIISSLEEVMGLICDISGFGGNIGTGCGQLAEFASVVKATDAIGGDSKLWEEVLDENFEGANAHCLLSLAYQEPALLRKGPSAEGFQLVPRKGWTGSLTSEVQAKRQTVYMFGEGSVFDSKMSGGLVDITPIDNSSHIWAGRHNVYRYGYAFTVPMKIGIKE